ncbi:uncharacterized protein LOC121864526 [Homarus americanus]|uniref:uncharacterized protein LOC121864526 n=1 Tax=Homarus americanus TaxID=6706 RepID=UPI001C47EC40|nr:uncharacterized protein LOC121864526 [Homarus americanus]
MKRTIYMWSVSRMGRRLWLWCAGGKVMPFLLLLLLLQAPSSTTFKFKVGQCRAFPVVSNFRPDQFAGVWYVVQMTNTAASCYSLTFTQGPGDGISSVDFRKQIWGLNAAGIHNTVTFTAPTHSIDHGGAHMAMALPTEAWGWVGVQVVDTDYQEWAALWACKKTLFGHLEAAIILSRDTFLPPQRLWEVRVMMAGAGSDLEDLSTIQHTHCLTTQGGRKMTIEFDPNLDKPNVHFQSLFTSSGAVDSGDINNNSTEVGGTRRPRPCVDELDDYYYYYEDCPDDVSNPIYTTLEEFENDNNSDDSSTTDDNNSGTSAGDGGSDPCYTVEDDYWEYKTDCPTDAEYILSLDEYDELYPDDEGEGGDDEEEGKGEEEKDNDTSKFDGRSCVVDDGEEYILYDECPEDVNTAQLPEDFYSDTDFTDTPCYIYEEGEYLYYDTCPDDASAPIPVEFFDDYGETRRSLITTQVGRGVRKVDKDSDKKKEREEKREGTSKEKEFKKENKGNERDGNMINKKDSKGTKNNNKKVRERKMRENAKENGIRETKDKKEKHGETKHKNDIINENILGRTHDRQESRDVLMTVKSLRRTMTVKSPVQSLRPYS